MESNLSKRSKRLGRGLNALIPEIDEEIDKKDIIEIKLDKIRPNKNQPRKKFDEEKIRILSQSIKNFGVLQPIVLKPVEDGNYMIIAGERRYRASILAEKEEIPAVIKDMPIKDIMEIALIENLQREDLNAIEEALAYKNLLEELKLTQEELSEKLGKSRSHIANTVRLLTLPEEVITHINNGDLSMGHGRAILGLKNKAHIKRVVEKTLEEKLNVRQIEKMILSLNENKVKTKQITPKRDVFIVKQEEELRNVLGTAVKIQKNKNKGKIEIDFYNDDDLERLLTYLKK